MSERVVSLSDRGRALEWLSLGFGLWLIAAVLSPLLSMEMRSSAAAEDVIALQRTLGVIALALQVAAIAAMAVGAGQLARTRPRLWFATALGALALLLAARTSIAWIALVPIHSHLELTRLLRTTSIVGSMAQLVLVVAFLLGLREVARAERGDVPAPVLGVAIGSELVRVISSGAIQIGGGPPAAAPWLRDIFFAALAVVGAGMVLLAIRATAAAVRAQMWAGQAGATSPARAADWHRAARGLDRFGAFLVARIALDAAAIPIVIVAALTGLGGLFTVQVYAVPLAGVLCSAGMAAGLVASRAIPDPPEARTGFTGAALLLAACVAGDLYLTWARGWQPLAETFSALAHLVVYLAALRSIRRTAERLGDEELARRARSLGWFAALAVGGATVGGYLLLRNASELALEIAAPVAVAGVAFAALLPCALLARELARTLRARFAEPPRARASFLHSS